MTPAPPERGDGVARGLALAAGLGFAVSLVAAAAGQVVAVAVELARPFDGPAVDLGWLYVAAFHHVGVRISITASSVIAGAIRLPTSGAAELSLAFLSATAGLLWLLHRAGRAAAAYAGGGGLRRALVGAGVAPTYALPIWIAALVVRYHADVPSNVVVTGSFDVRAVAWQALVLPLALAATAGLAGGLASARRDGSATARAIAAVVHGGVVAFGAGLLLAFVGLLVLAALDPSATRGYFDAVTAPGARGTTALLAHHVLLLPNQSLWVLVPSMGGCDVVRAGDVTPFLCPWRVPVLHLGGGLAGLAPTVGSERPPAGYLLFVLVPLVSVVLGGLRAATIADPRSPAERVAIGAAAGVVFAALVCAASWLASVAASARIPGVIDRAVLIGPDVPTAAALGLAWGLVGGAAGALLSVRSRSSASPAPAAGSPPG